MKISIDEVIGGLTKDVKKLECQIHKKTLMLKEKTRLLKDYELKRSSGILWVNPLLEGQRGDFAQPAAVSRAVRLLVR